MATAFSRSFRSLAADRSTRMLWVLALGALLVAAWIVWAVVARVPIYEVSEDGRFEVVGGAHVVQAPTAGSVIASKLSLGAEVTEGQVLVELDASELTKMLDEKLIEQKSFKSALVALDKELQAVREVLGIARKAESAAVAEARAAERAAKPEADHASRRAADLAKRGKTSRAFSKAEIERARVDAEARNKALARLKRGVARLALDHETQLGDRRVVLQRLEREASSLVASVAKLVPSIERLEFAIDRRKIRASATGVIGKLAELTTGSFVSEGMALFTIVPTGAPLRVVAQFHPAVSLGRIAPGQTAQLRLHGFPWAQYGRTPAKVTSIGSEIANGTVRVELEVNVADSVLTLQHGLGTSVDVEVERVAPITLLLRAAGKLVDSGPGSTGADGGGA